MPHFAGGKQKDCGNEPRPPLLFPIKSHINSSQAYTYQTALLVISCLPDSCTEEEHMAILAIHHPLAFTFGLLGNLVSLMVYLAPVPTFYRIYKKKSTEGFQSVPYVVALFSSMLWIYYAFFQTSASLLITINSVGCVIETVYIVLFITYAPRQARVFTAKLLLLLNVGVFGAIVFLTLLLTSGPKRVQALGWVCVAFSVSVFAAPLSIMRRVIKTKSVEYMPFSLSFFLTLSAVMWFAYGFFLKDYYIAMPNVLGLAFGIMQMVLYALYRGANKGVKEDKLPEHFEATPKMGTVVGSEVHPIDAQQPHNEGLLEEDHEANTSMVKTERVNRKAAEVYMIICEV